MAKVAYAMVLLLGLLAGATATVERQKQKSEVLDDESRPRATYADPRAAGEDKILARLGTQMGAETVQAAFLQNSPAKPHVSKYYSYLKKKTCSQGRIGKDGTDGDSRMEPRSPLSRQSLTTYHSGESSAEPSRRQAISTSLSCDPDNLADHILQHCAPGKPSPDCCEPLLAAVWAQPNSGCLCSTLLTQRMLTQAFITDDKAIELCFLCGAPRGMETCGIDAAPPPSTAVSPSISPTSASDSPPPAQLTSPPPPSPPTASAKKRHGWLIPVVVACCAIGIIAVSGTALFLSWRCKVQARVRVRDTELPTWLTPSASPVSALSEARISMPSSPSSPSRVKRPIVPPSSPVRAGTSLPPSPPFAPPVPVPRPTSPPSSPLLLEVQPLLTGRVMAPPPLLQLSGHKRKAPPPLLQPGRKRKALQRDSVTVQPPPLRRTGRKRRAPNRYSP